MKHIEKDQYGYLSTRGVSKYWGVSKNQTPAVGPDPWVVKYADAFIEKGEGNRYRTFTADSEFTLRETDAAVIASYFFENRLPYHEHPKKMSFINGSRVLILDLVTKKISLEKFQLPAAQPLAISEEKQKLLDDQQRIYDETLAAILKDNEVVEEESEFDTTFAAGFALRDIIENRLGKKTLNEVLAVIQARLSKEF